jgi:hypothetical protein
MDRGWIYFQHVHLTIHRCFQASKNRLSKIGQSVFTRFQCSIWQNDRLAKPQSAVNRSTSSICIQLFTGAPKRLKIDFRWQLSQIVNVVSDRRPLQLDQTKPSALGDLEIMPIADLRFSQWLSTKKMCVVCVWSLVILIPLSPRFFSDNRRTPPPNLLLHSMMLNQLWTWYVAIRSGRKPGDQSRCRVTVELNNPALLTPPLPATPIGHRKCRVLPGIGLLFWSLVLRRVCDWRS